jgi:hypothetical protein
VYKILRFAVGLFPRLLKRGQKVCPPRQALEGFMRGQLGAEDNLRVLLHLAPGCTRCQEITADLWWAGAGRGGRIAAVADYGQSVDRVFARVRHIQTGLEEERVVARRILAGLAGLPVTAWGVRLADEGLARLAAEIACEIPVAVHPAGLVEELIARAWIAIAEARRAAVDLPGAEEALRTAEGHLARGSGERLEKARLHEAQAALLADQGRFREADRLLHRALVVYRRTGQADLLGRAFVQQGYLRACAGDLGGAAASLRQGLALASAVGDPVTALAALFSLACLLHDGGRHREARALLARIDPRQAAGAARGRLIQLEGRITAALR